DLPSIVDTLFRPSESAATMWLGRDSTLISSTLSTLGNHYRVARRYEDSVPAWEAARDHAIKVYGAGHSKNAWYESYLGTAYIDSGRLDEAVAVLERAVKTQTKEQEAGDQSALLTVIALAKAFLAVGRTDAAIAYIRQLHDAYKNRVRPNTSFYA